MQHLKDYWNDIWNNVAFVSHINLQWPYCIANISLQTLGRVCVCKSYFPAATVQSDVGG